MDTFRRISVTATALSMAAGGLLAVSTSPASAAPTAPKAAAAISAPAVSPTSPYGASINSTDDVDRLTTMLNRPLSSVRVFLTGIPANWTQYPLLMTIPVNGTVALSFQSGTPTALTSFLNTRPTEMKCYVTYWHEPEDNFTTATQKAAYRASWHTYAPAIRAAGCIPTLILMKWTLNPKSGTDWHDWFPTPGDVDVFAFDAYNAKAKTGGYGIPSNYLAPIIAASRDTGLPWALTELGSDIPAGTNPSERAAWAHGVAQAAAADPGFLFADWWDVLSTTGRDYSLDSATALAWNNGPATAPSAPTGVSVMAGTGSAAVAWTAPGDGGSPITGYRATATNTGTGAATSQTTLAGTTSTTVTGLTNGQTYNVSVTATNTVGTSTGSAPQSVIPGTVATVPGSPGIGTATPGNTAASVSWTPPSDNGGSTITGYTATAVNTDTGSAAGSVTVSATTTSATVTGLTNGQSYTLRVRATNAIGDGASSAPSNGVTPASVPGAPTIGTATAGNASASVTWAAPASSGGGAITGYRMTAYNSGGSTAATATAGGSATSGTVSGLSNGKTYTVKVVATSAVGDSPASGASNAVTPITTPDVPVLGAATGGVKTDTVVSATAWWQGVVSNGGSPVTGFRVIAEHWSGGAMVSSTTSAVQPASARSLQFGGLITAATYKFRVCAINAAGASAYSAPSNLASAY